MLQFTTFSMFHKDSSLVTLHTVLMRLPDNDLLWRILEFDAVGEAPEWARQDAFADVALNAPDGYRVSWRNLQALACRTEQLWNGLIVATDPKITISRTDIETDGFPGCSYVIEAFDSSEWTIGTESKSILDRFSEFKMDWMLPLDSMSRSIEELEGIAWPASSVAQTGHALRRKKLLQLTTADLRLGLEQQIGVDILAPLAAKRLRSDPLVEAQLYPGDLLQCLLEVPSSCWQQSGTAG